MEITAIAEGSGGAYPTAAALLACDDRLAFDVRHPAWGVLRCQAPSLAQQEQIHRASQIAAVQQARRDMLAHALDVPWTALLPADGRDWRVFCVETLRQCLLAPRLTSAQAQQLMEHNPDAIESLVTYIWSRVALDEAALAALVHAAVGGAGDPA